MYFVNCYYDEPYPEEHIFSDYDSAYEFFYEVISCDFISSIDTNLFIHSPEVY